MSMDKQLFVGLDFTSKLVGFSVTDKAELMERLIRRHQQTQGMSNHQKIEFIDSRQNNKEEQNDIWMTRFLIRGVCHLDKRPAILDFSHNNYEHLQCECDCSSELDECVQRLNLLAEEINKNLFNGRSIEETSTIFVILPTDLAKRGKRLFRRAVHQAGMITSEDSQSLVLITDLEVLVVNAELFGSESLCLERGKRLLVAIAHEWLETCVHEVEITSLRPFRIQSTEDPMLSSSAKEVVTEVRRVLQSWDPKDTLTVLIAGPPAARTELQNTIRSTLADHCSNHRIQIVHSEINMTGSKKKVGERKTLADAALTWGLAEELLNDRAAYSYGIAVVLTGEEETFHPLVHKGDLLKIGHRVDTTVQPVQSRQSQIAVQLYRSAETHPEGVSVSDAQCLATVVVDCPVAANANAESGYNYAADVKASLVFGELQIEMRFENAQGQLWTHTVCDVHMRVGERAGACRVAHENDAPRVVSSALEQVTARRHHQKTPGFGNRLDATVSIALAETHAILAYAFGATPNHMVFLAGQAVGDHTVCTSLLEQPDGTWLFGGDAETKYAEALMACGPGEIPAVHLYRDYRAIFREKHVGVFDAQTTVKSVSGKSQSLLVLLTEALRHIASALVKAMVPGLGGKRLAYKDVRWVLTLPADYSPDIKALLRAAAMCAGIIEHEQSDHLIVISEPDAVAVAANSLLAAAAPHSPTASSANSKLLLSPGTRFVVIDFGLEVTLISSHMCCSGAPLVIQPVAGAARKAKAPHGGNSVILAFVAFYEELLGDLSNSMDTSEKEQLHRDFSHIQATFDGSAFPGDIRLSHLLEQRNQLVELAAVWNDKHPNQTIRATPTQRNGFLAISKELMLSFYEPLLKETVQSLADILGQVSGIKYIVLAGKCGGNKVLQKQLMSSFPEQKLLVFDKYSSSSQGAVAQGALHYGLHYTSTVHAPHTYGVATEGDAFHVLVRKGQVLQGDEEVRVVVAPQRPSQRLLAVRIYKSESKYPVTTKGAHLMGTVSIPCCSVEPPGRCEFEVAFDPNSKASRLHVVVRNLQDGSTKEGSIG